jgi:hypothetical protein
MVTVEQARNVLIKNINTLKLIRKGLLEIDGLYSGRYYFFYRPSCDLLPENCICFRCFRQGHLAV